MLFVQDASSQLPGHELISAGIADLAAGRESEAALIIAMAAPRLRVLGYDVPTCIEQNASHRLYDLLSEVRTDAHSHYNSLVRRVVSFLRAAESAAAR